MTGPGMSGRRPRLRRQAGFTLIEAMVVVAIAGILASVAYPAYLQQVGRSRRVDAQAVLMQAAQYVEAFHTENMRYDQNSSGVALALPARLTHSPLDGATKYYDVSIRSVATQRYQLQAVPKGSQLQDRCGSLTLDNTGLKSATLADCWGR